MISDLVYVSSDVGAQHSISYIVDYIGINIDFGMKFE